MAKSKGLAQFIALKQRSYKQAMYSLPQPKTAVDLALKAYKELKAGVSNAR